jgi:hypothetical protein
LETPPMLTLARRFEFAHRSYQGRLPAIGCDGRVEGAALDLTHWPGNRTPAEYQADTSTEIALKFVAAAESMERWAEAVVVNNHFDTDGVLSVWTLLDPNSAQAYRDLLIAAAEAGDFDEWPRDDRGLWLDAVIRALGEAAGDDAAAYELVLPLLPELIESLDHHKDLWGHDWEALGRAVSALEAGQIRADRFGHVGLMWHAPGQPEAPGPLLARRFLPGAKRYLLAFDQGNGHFSYRYERPRYAWAQTVDRPPIAEPDAHALAQALGPAWTDEGLPGMTGLVHTQFPTRIAPELLIRQLGSIDLV